MDSWGSHAGRVKMVNEGSGRGRVDCGVKPNRATRQAAGRRRKGGEASFVVGTSGGDSRMKTREGIGTEERGLCGGNCICGGEEEAWRKA